MVLSKAAPPRIVPLRGSTRPVGRPVTIETLREEARIQRVEESDFIRRARYLGLRAIYGGEYDPPMAAEAGRALVHLAERRLAQLGGDAA